MASPDKTPLHIFAPIPLTVAWSEGLPHDEDCPGCEIERLEAVVVRLREALRQLLEFAEYLDRDQHDTRGVGEYEPSEEIVEAQAVVVSPDKPPEPDVSFYERCLCEYSRCPIHGEGSPAVGGEQE